MFLYIFTDGQIKQVSENPTIVDLLAVSQSLLTIIKFDKKKGFFRLIKDESKLCWVPVKDAQVLTSETDRVHL